MLTAPIKVGVSTSFSARPSTPRELIATRPDVCTSKRATGYESFTPGEDTGAHGTVK
jgi:hypothetical protein